MSKLTPLEKIEVTRQIFSLMKLLHESEALAGVVLTNDTYDDFKMYFGQAAIPYAPGDISVDPNMEQFFVAHGLLVMRGTQLQ